MARSGVNRKDQEKNGENASDEETLMVGRCPTITLSSLAPVSLCSPINITIDLQRFCVLFPPVEAVQNVSLW